MLKKILKITALCLVMLAAAAAVYWQVNGDRLRAEYAAFKKMQNSPGFSPVIPTQENFRE